ncbi:MAG: hypothetical protein LBJ84_03410 [Oscillospiraceae bacterium]|jgi:hypothetical protein|nr:hypothetical protein [Oscillospiraceae bacterium]
MEIVIAMDEIAAWVQGRVCDGYKMKAPPPHDASPVDGKYEYELLTPTAFPMFRPTRDRLPPSVAAPVPSVCVQFVEGKDEQFSASGSMRVRLVFATWSPGLHGRDVFRPKDGGGGVYAQWGGEEARAFYRRDAEGWREAWNLVDTARREIESVEHIGGGLRVIHADGIAFGPVAEQETIIDFYPYWYAWVEFGVGFGLQRHRRELSDFL